MRALVCAFSTTQSCSRARARRNGRTSGRCSSNRNRSGSLPHPLPAQVAPYQLSPRYHRTPTLPLPHATRDTRHARAGLPCTIHFHEPLSLSFRRGALQRSSLHHRTPSWTTSSSRRSEYARVPPSLSRVCHDSFAFILSVSPSLTLFRSFFVDCARLQTKKERSASVSVTASKTEAKHKKLKRKFLEKNKVRVAHARSLRWLLAPPLTQLCVACCRWDRSSRTR